MKQVENIKECFELLRNALTLKEMKSISEILPKWSGEWDFVKANISANGMTIRIFNVFFDRAKNSIDTNHEDVWIAYNPADDEEYVNIPSVWVVTKDSSYDGEWEIDATVFSTYEAAKAYMDECVDEFKRDDHLWVNGENMWDSHDTDFECYVDGEYNEDHWHIALERKLIH